MNVVSEEDLAHIEKASEAIDRLMQQLKEIAINLSPASIARKGLHYALEDFSRIPGTALCKRSRIIP